jgi:hypothetical protein
MWKSIDHNEKYGPWAAEFSFKNEETELENRGTNRTGETTTTGSHLSRHLPRPLGDLRPFHPVTGSGPVDENGEQRRPYTGT